MTNREKRENRWGILFSLPCILGFLIFALLPMVVSLGLSFTNYNFTTGGQFIGATIKICLAEVIRISINHYL